MCNACCKQFTLIGYFSRYNLKSAQSMCKIFTNMCNWKWKVPNQCVMLAASNSHWLGTFQGITPYLLKVCHYSYMKSTQSMWIACSKHFTLIGLYISKISCQFQNCLINVWKLPNQCELLAASITHWLGTFHFQFCFCFCLPKVRLVPQSPMLLNLLIPVLKSLPMGDREPKIYFRVQLLKNLLGKILHKNQIWWHSISQMSVTVVYL